MNNTFSAEKKIILNITNIVPVIVLLFCYVNIWRAYLIDSLNILVAFTAITYIAAGIRMARKPSIGIPFADVCIFASLLILMIAFVSNYQGEDLLKDIFLYHMTAMLFFPFIVLLKGTDIRRTVILVFAIIFWVDSCVLLIELTDGLLDIDVHRYGIFDWYIQVNDPGRFLQFTMDGHAAGFYEIIPSALGLRGYPNYTAPLFTASFVILLAIKYSQKKPSGNFKLKRLFFLFFGSTLILMLGVKSHMVTLVISMIFIAFYLNRTMFRHLLAGGLTLFVVGLFTEYGMQVVSSINEQLFQGGYQAIESGEAGQRINEPGRLEIIFNFQDYSAFLDLSIRDFLFGATRFTVLQEWNFFFEQKILVIGLVVGAPFVAVFLLLSIRSINILFKSYKLVESDSEKGLYIGTLLAILILTLEVGHFGATFYYPNYQVMGFLLAVSVVFYRNIRNQYSAVNQRQNIPIKAGTT